MLAAQIEETVAKPDILGIVGIAEYRQRQFGRPGPSTSISLDIDLDRAGRQLGILGAVRRGRRTLPSTRTTHSERKVSATLKAGLSGSATHLGQAIMIAQIDEQHAAMVADAMAPAGEADLAADVGLLEVRRIYGCGSDAWLNSARLKQE